MNEIETFIESALNTLDAHNKSINILSTIVDKNSRKINELEEKINNLSKNKRKWLWN